MQKAGIIAALQPAFIYGEADGYPGLLSREKQGEFLPLASYARAGGVRGPGHRRAAGSPQPVLGPVLGGDPQGGHQLEVRERVTPAAALRMMTLNGAYLSGEEHIKGSLEVGKLADLAVLLTDLAFVSEEDLRAISVDLTVIDGRVVYRREART
ncbi:MAG: amidohydrolase family protein [Bacillota bacterium]